MIRRGAGGERERELAIQERITPREVVPESASTQMSMLTTANRQNPSNRRGKGKHTNVNMSLETKVKGSVKSEKIFKENVRKEELTRINWAINWSWCVDLFREREKEILEYKKKKAIEKGSKEFFDERTVRPFPLTCSREIGWLSSRKEFQLEIFGSYFDNLKLTQNPPEASSSIFYYSRAS